MRRLGSALLATAVVAALGAAAVGCGSGGAADTGVDVGATSSGPAYEQVAMVTVTEGGGQVTDELTFIDSERSLHRYVDVFPSEQLQREVLAAAQYADLADGERLAAAVVDLGCSPPTRVVVTGSGADLRITASGKPTVDIQCLAPITTVALVGVSAASAS